MNLQKLLENQNILLKHMKEINYCFQYIDSFKRELKWLRENAENYHFKTYTEIYDFRVKTKKCQDAKYHCKSMYAIFQRFEEDDELPCRKRGRPLNYRATYYKLNSFYAGIIDTYRSGAEKGGYSENTIEKCVSKSSCFFYFLQQKGFSTLENVDEATVLSFFTDCDGKLSKSRSYKRDIETVLKFELGEVSLQAKILAEFLPAIRKTRKNIQFLKPDESEAIKNVLGNDSNSLTLRDRAIGKLLYYAGIRAGDIAELKLSEICWDKDAIVFYQGKTNIQISIPLSANVGNTIFDYIVNERPKVDDNHVFLWMHQPFLPLSPDAIWQIANKIFKLAEIRQDGHSRRGTHIFRHHLATFLAHEGVARPIISETLGHIAPESLDYYLSADAEHLRECSLSIADFPVSKEVFMI